MSESMQHRFFTYLKRGIKYVIHGVPTTYITADIHCLQPNKQLKNKKIIITGGSKGIGKALALKFVSEGANVLITGRDENVLQISAKEIRCNYYVLDVMDITAFEKFIDTAYNILGGIDALINNAGISLHEGDILNVTENDFDKQFDTNLKGAYFLAQAFIKKVLPEKDARKNILFISSERGEQADVIPYGLTKAAINSLVQGLAKFYKNRGIRVNAVAPGVTASELTGYSENGNLYYPYNSSSRIYMPQEVAEVATFLLSDAAACLSGQILVCNEAKTVNSYF